jgi:hypothetical protein
MVNSLFPYPDINMVLDKLMLNRLDTLGTHLAGLYPHFYTLRLLVIVSSRNPLPPLSFEPLIRVGCPDHKCGGH